VQKIERRLSALSNVGPYTSIYDEKISGFTRSSILYDISRLRVNITIIVNEINGIVVNLTEVYQKLLS
jgi:hypothetical protein